MDWSLSQKLRIIYGVSACFILMIAVLILMDLFWVAALVPVALIIIGLALFRMDILLLIIVFMTPLSVSLDDIAGDLGLHLPTEPLMFGAMLVFLIKVFYDHQFDFKVLRNPLTIAITLNLIWLVISSMTSEMPLVSWKFFLSRFWFIITCYLLATQLFRNSKNFKRFMWLYTVPLVGVVIYTIIRQGMHSFDEKSAHWVMQPFFKDHTSYGALVAMFIPIVISFLWTKSTSLYSKIILGFLLTILIAGVILSYTRAAWVSLVAGYGVYVILRFKIPFRVVMVGIVVAIGMFFTFQEDIFQRLEKNRQDSSSDLSEHVESISNVASDASNLERINRWHSALRMFEERPLVGWGPGTYSFQYARFQHSSELTIISTNFGDGGNAHSEYFGPLAETGIPGLLTFLIIIAIFYYRGVALYKRLDDHDFRSILLGILVAQTTYLVHGLLNNFLDTDKASIPFWGFMAMLVALELYHSKKEKGQLNEANTD